MNILYQKQSPQKNGFLDENDNVDLSYIHKRDESAETRVRPK